MDEPKQTIRSALPARFAACVGLATLFFWDHIRLLTNAENRYSAHWDSADPWLILGMIVGLGACLFATGRIIDRIGLHWLTSLKTALFVLVAGVGVTAFLHKGLVSGSGPWSSVCMGILCLCAVLALLSLHQRFEKIPLGFRKACIGFCVAGGLLALQMFAWPTYGVSPKTCDSHEIQPLAFTGTETTPDVYVILFDAWSWTRSLGETDPIDMEAEWPHLMSLVEDSTVYEEAYSPYIPTMQSIPQLFFQTPSHFVLEDSGRCRFYDPVHRLFREMRGERNLFSWMKESGYQTHYAGWGYPWHHFVGEDVDDGLYVNSLPVTKHEAGLAGRAGWHLGYGMIRFLKSIPAPLAVRWRIGIPLLDYGNWHFAKMNEVIHERARTIVSDAEGPDFAVIFYGVPHPPFACDRDGLRSDILLLEGNTPEVGYDNPEAVVEGYQANLRYADTLLGDLISSLKASGRYDSSLIIVTSDHCFAGDPRLQDDFGGNAKAYYDSRTHVPLIVKAPRQKHSERVTDRTDLINLHTLIESHTDLAPMFD